MCNLYAETRNTKAIRDLFKVASNRATEVEPKDTIFPAHMAPVVRLAEDGGGSLWNSRGASCSCSPPGERATWHWFALVGDEPRAMVSFAGIWQR